MIKDIFWTVVAGGVAGLAVAMIVRVLFLPPMEPWFALMFGFVCATIGIWVASGVRVLMLERR